MLIAAAVRANQSRTNERVRALATSLGAKITSREQPLRGSELVIQAGFQISPVIEDAIERRIPFLILENGIWHYGDKPATYTVAYNGLNGLGWIPTPPRIKRPHPKLEPWRRYKPGDRVTIFGQMDGDKSLRGADIYQWAERCQEILPQAVFREHPNMLPKREWPDMEPFEECLEKTSLAVTYSSTVGAEAVIAGIPTVAMHPGSLAWEVSSHSLMSPPVYPDRRKWIHEMSWRHWRTDEPMNAGWLLGGYDEARARAEEGKYDNCNNGRAYKAGYAGVLPTGAQREGEGESLRDYRSA